MRPPPLSSEVVMARVREAYLASSLSYAEIGSRMGYKDRAVGKQTAFWFVNLTRNPSAVTLYKFAHALGIPVQHFLARVPSKPVLTTV